MSNARIHLRLLAEPPSIVEEPKAKICGTIQGEVHESDIKLPHLQIVYDVGSLSQTFNPGDLVLDKDTKLASMGEKLHVIILNARQFWKERLSMEAYKNGDRPRSFDKEDDAIKAGGITRWGDDGKMPTFSKALALNMLVERPKGVVSGLFGIPILKQLYAPATWTLEKSGYNKAAPTILACSQLTLRRLGGIHAGTFSIRTEKQPVRGCRIIMPVVKLESYNSKKKIHAIERAFK